MNTKKLARLLKEEGLRKESYMPDYYDYSPKWEESESANIRRGVFFGGQQYYSATIYISNDSVQLELYEQSNRRGRSRLLESPNDSITEREASRAIRDMIRHMSTTGEVPDEV
jgi:glycogen synthase